jgi:hypothetical protein
METIFLSLFVLFFFFCLVHVSYANLWIPCSCLMINKLENTFYYCYIKTSSTSQDLRDAHSNDLTRRRRDSHKGTRAGVQRDW